MSVVCTSKYTQNQQKDRGPEKTTRVSDYLMLQNSTTSKYSTQQTLISMYHDTQKLIFHESKTWVLKLKR